MKVNGDNHPGMFRAMKGSSNQFGVVTKFTMKTFPMNGVREEGPRVEDCS